MPWPMLDEKYLMCQDDISLDDVHEFIFNPLRPRMEGKTKSDIIKMELLKWQKDEIERIERWIMIEESVFVIPMAEKIANYLMQLLAEA